MPLMEPNTVELTKRHNVQVNPETKVRLEAHRLKYKASYGQVIDALLDFYDKHKDD